MGTKVEPEELSYKKLKKFIDFNHPVDPHLGVKFPVSDSITVKSHTFKLFDAFGCIRVLEKFSKMKDRFFNKLFKKPKKKLQTPSSMGDLPDSDSGGEEEGPFKGLTDSAMYIGEGPILYLQIVKSFAIMFFVLGLINVPCFWIYSRANEV